jgi:hypothetical protein
MADVSAPKAPSNGLSRWNETARPTSTVPLMIGTIAERNASRAAVIAMGMATLETTFTSQGPTFPTTRSSADAELQRDRWRELG